MYLCLYIHITIETQVDNIHKSGNVREKEKKGGGKRKIKIVEEKEGRKERKKQTNK
jgi:hypothetical protein